MPLSREIFQQYSAFRWQVPLEGEASLRPVAHPHRLDPDELLGIDRAKAVLTRNTRCFVDGLPANDALLWGSRGTGKSSLVKALATRFADKGLKIVEINKGDLLHLPDILEQLRPLPHPFLLFCDELSFEAGDPAHKTLKGVLEGGVEARPANVLLYATSNRRHLMPRAFEADPTAAQGEIHPHESAEEEISLSDRFGLWLGFHPFDQETYLAIVMAHARRLDLGVSSETLRREALDWARLRGARSGRVARQFMIDMRGRGSQK
ncbi:MAG: ATP-binding protein [Magnetococcales bacterium]|nr:ATP-binding protein [Magnetococcales bacterium]